MKKILMLIIVIVVIVICFGIGCGLGFGRGDGSGNGNNTSQASQEMTQEEENSLSEESNATSIVVMLTVVENDYFYENERISIEDFVKKIERIEEDYVIEIKEDRASLKAYNNLLDKLDEINVDYIEK